MTMIAFGSGSTSIKPIMDSSGNSIANPTPQTIPGQQSFDFSLDSDFKTFHGVGRFALYAAPGKTKASGKVTGLINGRLIRDIWAGGTMTAGTIQQVYSTPAAGIQIPSASPVTVDVTTLLPTGATWVEDLGMLDSAGRPMECVASAPATGQYSVANGVYTFAVADEGKTVFNKSLYSMAAPAAKNISLDNISMGSGPVCKLVYYTKYQGKSVLIVLLNVVFPKLALLAAKNDDYSSQNMEFEAFADMATGTTLGYIYISE